MRCACVDIGTNTTRLLVAEADGEDPPGLREVSAERVFNADVAPAVSAPRLVAAARAAGAEEVVVVGTAGLRGDPALSGAIGVPVRILSPEEEARYAFSGATHCAEAAPDEPVAVVDVGGGSSEIVCGTARGGVSWVASLPIGSRSLTDGCRDVDAARARVAAVFAGLAPPPVQAAYAVGGSATSLRLLCGDVIDADSLSRALPRVRDADLHPERARVLPAGMLVLEAASRLLALPLQIAAGGLREGILLERLRARLQ